MAEHYHVRMLNLETGEEAVEGPFTTDMNAVDYADRIAATYFGGDDVTWFERTDAPDYVLHVGRISEDGTRSEALVEISITEEEVDDTSDTNGDDDAP